MSTTEPNETQPESALSLPRRRRRRSRGRRPLCRRSGSSCPSLCRTLGRGPVLLCLLHAPRDARAHEACAATDPGSDHQDRHEPQASADPCDQRLRPLPSGLRRRRGSGRAISLAVLRRRRVSGTVTRARARRCVHANTLRRLTARRLALPTQRARPSTPSTSRWTPVADGPSSTGRRYLARCAQRCPGVHPIPTKCRGNTDLDSRTAGPPGCPTSIWGIHISTL